MLEVSPPAAPLLLPPEEPDDPPLKPEPQAVRASTLAAAAMPAVIRFVRRCMSASSFYSVADAGTAPTGAVEPDESGVSAAAATTAAAADQACGRQAAG